MMNILKKSLLITFVFLFISKITNAQNYLKDIISNVTPLSPEASSIQKFGNLPINYSVGLPSISVPIFSYSNKELELEIGLNYSAGGIKVDEISSSIGIGWSLGAGGVISRMVRGTYDELVLDGFLNSGPLPTSELLGNRPMEEYDRPFNKMQQNRLDPQNDVFNFSFGGSSGTFYLGKNNDILIAPQRKLKIEKFISTIDGKALISKFEITDEIGRKYIFEAFEVSTIFNGALNNTYTSSWYLTQIIAPNLKDKILISYTDVNLDRYDSYRNVSERRLANTGGGLVSSSELIAQSIKAKRISNILFPNGVQVNFLYNTSNRTDLTGDKSLIKIAIVDNYGGEKGFNLEQDYSLNRLTLKKVLPYVKNSTVIERPYEFLYNSALPAKLSFQQDHWGYYNNNATNNLIPAENFNSSIGGLTSLPGGNREVDPVRCLAGSLKRMKYPTGGYTDFEFGPNVADHEWHLKNQGYVGGIRINRMLDYDTISTSPVAIKEFDYLTEDGSKSSGEIGIYPLYSQAVYYEAADPYLVMEHNYSSYTPNYIIRSNSTVDNLVTLNGSPVNYRRVVERNYGKTGQYIGKIVREFSSLSVNNSFYFPQLPKSVLSWNSGLLLNETVFDAKDRKVTRKELKYNYIDDYFYQNSTRRENFRNQIIAPVKFRSSTTGNQLNFDGSPVYFLMNEFMPYSGRSELMNEKNSEFDSLGTELLAKSKSFSYDNEYFYKKTDTVRDSRDMLVISDYKYVPDMSKITGTATDIYREMLSKNIINRMIESTNKRGSKQIYYLRNDFVKLPSGAFDVKLKKEGVSASSFVQADFLLYDEYGNPTLIKDAQGKYISLVWDSKGHNLIGMNISPSSENFILLDVDNDGNRLSSSHIDAMTNVPGIKTDPTFGYAIDMTTGNGMLEFKAAFTANGIYEMVFWELGSDFGQNLGTAQILSSEIISTLGTWKKRRVRFKYLSGYLTIYSALGIIRNMTIQAEGSQTSTYTYSPLVGMKSKTDPRGVTEYYQYDGFQRLKAILNQFKDITKSFDYNYRPN
ncbi:hypothetical protein LZQ00_16840 [Sphingobacterium sp. SRCM116780]|uniref:hypothetical protein n=1 Tax=Sphingobacterium sp. SRCM116780 TaxID=2907623 RepID=UPI001F2AD470|nr:hypothetical protein [Sphingobacterium sp. SRCM116780]UIR55915.1 hypothetical protein LZQ00_16840 [Sphingobacterium sp. SRCM116780]